MVFIVCGTMSHAKLLLHWSVIHYVFGPDLDPNCLTL